MLPRKMGAIMNHDKVRCHHLYLDLFLVVYEPSYPNITQKFMY